MYESHHLRLWWFCVIKTFFKIKYMLFMYTQSRSRYDIFSSSHIHAHKCKHGQRDVKNETNAFFLWLLILCVRSFFLWKLLLTWLMHSWISLVMSLRQFDYSLPTISWFAILCLQTVFTKRCVNFLCKVRLLCLELIDFSVIIYTILFFAQFISVWVFRFGIRPQKNTVSIVAFDCNVNSFGNKQKN